MHSHCFLYASMLTLAACQGAETIVSEEAWRVGESSHRRTGVDARHVCALGETSSSCADAGRAGPSDVSDEEVVYAPGALPWAKPTHRVVFHRRAQSARYTSRSDFVGPETRFRQQDHPYIKGVPYSFMTLPGAMTLLDRARDHQTNRGDGPDQRGWVFVGSYLPTRLSPGDPPTLHLFHVPTEEMGPETHYRVGPLLFESSPYALFYGVPESSDPNTWLVQCDYPRVQMRPVTSVEAEDVLRTRLATHCDQNELNPSLPWELVLWAGREPERAWATSASLFSADIRSSTLDVRHSAGISEATEGVVHYLFRRVSLRD